MLEIFKTSKKSTQFYKYKRIYFRYGNTSESFYREIREDFFPKRKSDKWYEIEVSYRVSKERHKTYKYEKPVGINVSDAFIKKFDKEYENYIFKLRENKLKRIVL